MTLRGLLEAEEVASGEVGHALPGEVDEDDADFVDRAVDASATADPEDHVLQAALDELRTYGHATGR